MADKTPLILLPGLLNTETLWRHQSETLADIADIRVGDLTGHDSIVDMASSVLASAPETFALGGLSMGGYTALEIMRKAPQRVMRLALLDTSARPDTPERTEGRKAQMEMAREGRFEEVIAMTVPVMVNPDGPPNEALHETIRTMCRTVGPEAYARQQTALMHRPESRGDLAAIKCPTLVLCGRQDQPTPVEMHEELAAGIDGANLVIIEDCGHLAPLERPEEVTAAFRSWLQA